MFWVNICFYKYMVYILFLGIFFKFIGDIGLECLFFFIIGCINFFVIYFYKYIILIYYKNYLGFGLVA